MLIRWWGHRAWGGLVCFSKDQSVPTRVVTYSRASLTRTTILSCLLSLHMSTHKYPLAIVSQIQLPCVTVVRRDPPEHTGAVAFPPSSHQSHEPWNSLYKLPHFVCFYRNTDYTHQFSGILTKLIFGGKHCQEAQGLGLLCSGASRCRHWPHSVQQTEP